MKKVIGGFAALAFLFVVASCGGASESDLVGKWKLDASAIEVELGDGFPAEMKSEVKEGLKEMKSGKASDEMDKITFDFQEGGKLVMTADGDSQDLKWSIDGDYLVLKGDVEGMKGEVKLKIEDVSSDKMSVSLTGEDLLAQAKKQQPDLVDMASQGMGDVEKMAKGTKLTLGFKK